MLNQYFIKKVNCFLAKNKVKLNPQNLINFIKKE